MASKEGAEDVDEGSVLRYCCPQRMGGCGSTLIGIIFEAEGLGGVACGLEERFKVGGAKDLCQTGLVLRDPVCRR